MTERVCTPHSRSEREPNGPTFFSCPFCGKAPDPTDRSTLHPSGTFWRFEAEIGCRTYHSMRDRREGDGECYVMSCLTESGGCGARLSGDSEAEAIAAWNRRSTVSETKPPMDMDPLVAEAVVQELERIAQPREDESDFGRGYVLGQNDLRKHLLVAFRQGKK